MASQGRSSAPEAGRLERKERGVGEERRRERSAGGEARTVAELLGELRALVADSGVGEVGRGLWQGPRYS